MDEVEGGNNASNEELGLLLWESAFFIYVVAEIAALQQIHAQVQILSVLKCVQHIDDEVMVELSKDDSFVENRVHATFRDNPRLGHFFKRKHSAILFVGDFPDFTKASLSNTVEEFEVLFVNDYCFLAFLAYVCFELTISHQPWLFILLITSLLSLLF